MAEWSEIDGGQERAAADVVYQATCDLAQGWLDDALALGAVSELGALRPAAIVLGGLRALQLELRAIHADNGERMT